MGLPKLVVYCRGYDNGDKTFWRTKNAAKGQDITSALAKKNAARGREVPGGVNKGTGILGLDTGVPRQLIDL
jgi:hypothetical protein